MRTIVIAIATASLAAAAFAGEKPVQLKPGAGLDKVEAGCTACHSLDYVPMNSRFMDRKAWEASVNKMIKVMGAPISPEDAAKIVDYLASEYGKR